MSPSRFSSIDTATPATTRLFVLWIAISPLDHRPSRGYHSAREGFNATKRIARELSPANRLDTLEAVPYTYGFRHGVKGIGRDEAHVPTEQPSAQEDSRVPRAHEHQGRASCPIPAPRERAQASRTLTAAAPTAPFREHPASVPEGCSSKSTNADNA